MPDPSMSSPGISKSPSQESLFLYNHNLFLTGLHLKHQISSSPLTKFLFHSSCRHTSVLKALIWMNSIGDAIGPISVVTTLVTSQGMPRALQGTMECPDKIVYVIWNSLCLHDKISLYLPETEVLFFTDLSWDTGI